MDELPEISGEPVPLILEQVSQEEQKVIQDPENISPEKEEEEEKEKKEKKEEEKEEEKAEEEEEEEEDLNQMETIPEEESAEVVKTQTGNDLIGVTLVKRQIIAILVKKLFKKRSANQESHYIPLLKLVILALDQIRMSPEEANLKPRNIKKLGKAAARDLIYQYGSALRVLQMALGPESTEIQTNAIKHLNFRLDAFRNRPKTGLARFFSKWDTERLVYYTGACCLKHTTN